MHKILTKNISKYVDLDDNFPKWKLKSWNKCIKATSKFKSRFNELLVTSPSMEKETTQNSN